MSGFGGAVKLTGESEYRRALSQITQNLREVSSQMNVVSSAFSSNDKSIQALTAKEEVLNNKLTEQTNKLNVLKAQYASMSSQYSEQTSKHEALIASYNSEKQKLDEIGRELGTTSKEYQEQQKVVANLEQEVIKSTKAQDDNEKSMSKMRAEMNNAQADINKTTKEIDNLGKETEETSKQVDKAGDGFTVFKGIVANLASSAIQSAINALKRLGTAIVNVGKQAYSSYAEYEQLVGGVETLFGDSADIIMGYAENAYKTAGLSANKYMETVTSFSASLLQGLNGDTAKSAEIANMAITDMSDNANKMGTAMESIQNAYQGFAKQNYTMLDNLKLGYGGTKTEMLRLVKDAGVVEQSVKSLDEVSFAQIIEAIHIVQQQIGITGTTALEASNTIEGSTKSVKASWDNLLVAIADDNADLGKSINIFKDNLMVMVENSIPRIKQIVKGMWEGIKTLASQYMPEISEKVLPAFEKFFSLVKTIGSFFIQNISTVVPIIASLAVGIGVATKAQELWNLAMSANPIGAVIVAVTALIGIIYALTQIQTESMKQHQAEMDTLNDQYDAVMKNVSAWESLKDAKQKEVDASMSELSHYESLYRELQLITDENGKVQDGYETRASFITQELSQALGVEISMVDGVIQQYDTLKQQIDEVIEKKKAQIVLDSQETMYKEAIMGQEEALRNFNKAEDEYLAKKAEANALEQEYASALTDLNNARTRDEQIQAQQRIDSVYNEMRAKQEERDFAETIYNESKDLLNEYAYSIGQYEQNMQLAHEGRYDEMSTVTWNYVKDYEKADDAQRKILEDAVNNEKAHYKILLEAKQKSGSDLYDEQIKQSQELLRENERKLKEYNDATQRATDDAEIIWKRGLDKQLSDLTGSQIEFKSAGEGQVQMYVDGVASGKPKSTAEMADIVTATINEISTRETDSEEAGRNLIWGVNNGIANQYAQSSAFATVANFGRNLLAQLQYSLQEQSPSKATKKMGVNLLKGMQIGAQDEEKATIDQVTKIGEHVVEALDSELNQSISIGNIGVSASKSAGAYNNMVGAFKQALSEMKIELDGEVAGEFVDRTVTQLIYG